MCGDHHALRIAQQGHQLKELFAVKKGRDFHRFRDCVGFQFLFSDRER